MNSRQLPQFTSHLDRNEMRAVMFYLIIHVGIMPWVINYMTTKGIVTATEGNMLYYALGATYMLSACIRFLRRDFDPLCDRLFHCMMEIVVTYIAMVCINYCTSSSPRQYYYFWIKSNSL